MIDQNIRETIFISKATPEDDEFVLWLAPRLEAEGYLVFADVLGLHKSDRIKGLQPGDQWRKKVTSTLQDNAIKMVLCCTNETLAKDGVIEEIEIAKDLVNELSDNNFIIPLKLKKHKKLFGIGGLQYIDFEESWASGLSQLLDTLEKQNVPKSQDDVSINPDWENYKKRHSVGIERAPEVLTSNWLRISELPDDIFYYAPTGPISIGQLEAQCKFFEYPAEKHHRGFFSFANLEEINKAFEGVGKFEIKKKIPILEFMSYGCDEPNIAPREASNMIVSMCRQAWENLCRKRNFKEYLFSKQVAFHPTEDQIPIGKKLSWGRQGARRSSMLRNIAKGKVWQFGLSALPSFWPYPHFKIKSRVIFAEVNDNKAGSVIDDKGKQHRLRRSVCKGWRNKQWHGRFMAFMELLSLDSQYLSLPVGKSSSITIDTMPQMFTCPVTTELPDEMDEDEEEHDVSTLGNVMIEDDEDAA